MPHFGLMNTEDSFKSEEGALLRARLHIRAGRRRLRQGKISSGIVTLYDALLFAMESYIMSPQRREGLDIREGEDLKNDRTLYTVLTRSGVLDGKFDYETFDKLIDKESPEEMPGYDYKWILEGVESVMTQLGVMPFDEAALPPEDPKTF
ncbi:MAG: hypothetical protein ACHQ0Y_01155 [Thermodesulfovibrionales bacterium]